jgi:hypothetical protein
MQDWRSSPGGQGFAKKNPITSTAASIAGYLTPIVIFFALAWLVFHKLLKWF